MFKKDKIVFSTNPHTALSSFPQEALEDVVVVGCLGSVSDIQRLCSFPGLFEMVCSDGSVHAFLDSDEGVVVLHCDDGEENEAHALVAMLYVFLTSHAVVIFDTFFDPEWVRRLRLLSELRRCVHGAKGPPTLLTFCLEDSSVRFSHISTVLAEYRTMNDSNKRLFRLHDSSNQVISLSALAVWLSSAAGTRKTTLPSKIQAKKDLIEIAKSLLAASGSASLLSKPVARRLVVACNCGQRQVVLRDLTDSTAAPCCMDCNVALSASGSTSQWSLSVLPPGSSPGGPGFVDTSATSLLTFKHYSFGIEYECFAGHRFFLTDAMARVVLRLTQLDKLMTTDVPLYTRCLACKQQEAADSGPAQLMRLHVAALVPGQLVLDPILKFKLKSGQGHSFSFRVPCKPISICGLSYYVLRLPRCYAAPDNLGWVVQRDINSPFVAVLCAGWLTTDMLWLVVLLLVLFALVIVYDYVRTLLRLRELGLPYKLGWPLFYRLPFFLFHFEDLYDVVIKEMGSDSLRANKRAFLAPIMIISANPAVNKHILENVDKYEKGDMLRECMYPLLGDGIFNSDGKLWLEQRKAASFMFAKKELVQMVDVFVKHFEKDFQQHLVDGKPIEFQDLISKYTLDCFCEVAFGVETGALRGQSDFGNAFNQAQKSTTRRFVLQPWWKYIGFLLPSEKILRESVATLDSFIAGLINERRGDPQLSERNDLLSKLLQSNNFEEPKYVRDVLLNFILAGRDTTAQTILWSVYLLATNPEIYDKIVEEVNSNVEGEINFTKLKQLPYTLHFVYETLRLYPPVPSDPKQVVVDDVLPGGIKVYAGEYVMWSQNLMGRSDRFFHDPLKCNPDRWLGKDHNGGIEPSVWSNGFIPFQNGGRRTCLGQEMALLEVQAFLCCLVRSKISFTLAAGQKIKRVPNITISALNGIVVIPHRK